MLLTKRYGIEGYSIDDECNQYMHILTVRCNVCTLRVPSFSSWPSLSTAKAAVEPVPRPTTMPDFT
jgi:hypothetical protein